MILYLFGHVQYKVIVKIYYNILIPDEKCLNVLLWWIGSWISTFVVLLGFILLTKILRLKHFSASRLWNGWDFSHHSVSFFLLNSSTAMSWANSSKCMIFFLCSNVVQWHLKAVKILLFKALKGQSAAGYKLSQYWVSRYTERWNKEIHLSICLLSFPFLFLFIKVSTSIFPPLIYVSVIFLKC